MPRKQDKPTEAEAALGALRALYQGTLSSERITMRVDLLTPKMAARYLEDPERSRNRRISSAAVQELVRAILRGDFLLTGEPVIEDEDHHLLDGQHRCMAVVRTQVPIPTVFITGVDAEALKAMGTGRMRTGADTLQIFGLTADESGTLDPRALATTVKWLWKLLNGPGRIKGGRSPSNAETAALMESPWGPSLAAATRHLYGSPDFRSLTTGINGKGLFSGLYAATHFYLPECTSEFHEALSTAFGITSREDPIYHMHRRIREVSVGMRTARKTPAWLLLVFLIKTWNAWLERRKMKLLRHARDAPFPKILGGPAYFDRFGTHYNALTDEDYHPGDWMVDRDQFLLDGAGALRPMWWGRGAR